MHFCSPCSKICSIGILVQYIVVVFVLMYAFTLCTMHVGIYVYVLDRAISILRQILTAVEYIGECLILVFLQKKTN